MAAMGEDRGPQLAHICITFLALAVVTVTLRCIVRTRLIKVFGIDDWLMVVACLLFIMYCTCAIAGVLCGTGQHAWDLTPEDMRGALQYWWLCYIAYTTTMITVKVSVGTTLLRLIVNKIHKRILYTVIFTSVFTGTIFVFIAIFQCHPVPYFWNRAIDTDPGAGTCLPSNVVMGITYAYSSANALTDFTFGILPIFLVHDLHVDFKTKVMLVPILGMACIASCALLVRMAYVHEFADPDFLWATTDIAIWSSVEQGLAITAGSLATLRPLFRLVSVKLGLTSAGSTGAAGRSSGKRASPMPDLYRRSGGQGGPSASAGPSGTGGARGYHASVGALAAKRYGSEAYHRMDDLSGDTPDASRARLASKGVRYGQQTKVSGPERPESVWCWNKSLCGDDLHMTSWLQIEKRVDVEVRSEPHEHV